MKKTYILDTNVLLSDPNALTAFDEHDVIVPLAVLEELDRHKGRSDEVGKNARHISRQLDSFRDVANGLVKGVTLATGGCLRVAAIEESSAALIPRELSIAKTDNMIIGFMLNLEKQRVPGTYILVSKDINVRIKCDALGIKCEDYLRMRVTSDAKQFYRGVEVIESDEKSIEQFYREGSLVLNGDSTDKKLFSNQIIILKHTVGGQTKKSAIARFTGHGEPLVQVPKIDNVYGLKPRNKEQSFSLDLLLNQDIKLLTLVGPSGTGKTLLALAAALEQLKGLGSKQVYDKLVVTRPVQPVGKDIGFLPGTLEEKMEPWIAPIRDNLNFLMGNRGQRSKRRRTGETEDSYLALMQERGLIEIEAITFIRGRSIPNAFIVIDEAQNLSVHELKTIVTRVGDGTKIVLTGDIEQIDNVHVDSFSNGLTYAVERFKDYKIAGHVTLLKGERSQLATLASQIL